MSAELHLRERQLKELQEKYDKLKVELEVHQEDLIKAACDLLIPLPKPGTVMAQLIKANRLLRNRVKELETERDELDEKFCAAKRTLKWMRRLLDENKIPRRVLAE